MRYFILLIKLFLVGCLSTQSTTNFEDVDLGDGTFLNGSSGNPFFSSGNLELPVLYNSNYDSWTGWAISSVQDSVTAGFMNQFAARPASGFAGSDQYAVSFVAGRSVLRLKEAASGQTVEGLYVTNNTYAYLSMLNGDNFAKRFGGEDGTDPDFLLLTVKGYRDGNLTTDSVDFYLADYRFEDNSEDYVVADWRFLSLAALGGVDSLSFTMSGSDLSEVGLNTPAYFCIDNVITSGPLVSNREVADALPAVLYPNPAREKVRISPGTEWQLNRYRVMDILGRTLLEGLYQDTGIDVSQLSVGRYLLVGTTAEGEMVRGSFVK